MIADSSSRPIAWVGLGLICLGIGGCVGTNYISVHGGSIELNNRLRGDAKSTEGFDDPVFFSAGTCTAADGAVDDCHFITPLRNSLLTSEQLQRLRQSTFFWMESDGFPMASYELVARDLDIVDTQTPPRTLQSHLNVGTCWGFPGVEPESRKVLPDLQFLLNERSFARSMDVTLQECASSALNGAPSQDLNPVSDNCRDMSVRDINAAQPRPNPQLLPLCVINLPVPARAMADLSYAVTPTAAPGVDLGIKWPGVVVQRLPLRPHLKVVPVGGIRTIARRMELHFGPVDNQDGTSRVIAAFRVADDGNQWMENFSPNIKVINARVRLGPALGENSVFLPMDELEIGVPFTCHARSPQGDAIFVVPECSPMTQGPVNVTPAYYLADFAAGPIDDRARIEWLATLRIPNDQLDELQRGPLFLELDLTAFDGTLGTSGGGLRAEPAARDLGPVRSRARSVPLNAFVLSNPEAAPVRIDSITLTGRDAAEFGPPQVLPGPVGGSANVITMPAFVRGRSDVTVAVAPLFQTAGEKLAQLEVDFRDLAGNTRHVRAQLAALAVTPALELSPRQLAFYSRDFTTRSVPVEHAVVLINAGGASLTRRTVEFMGPAAGDYHLLRAEHGLTPSDLRQPLVLMGGDAEIYRIGFSPTTAGARSATLVIHTSEGDALVPLHGQCDGECRTLSRSRKSFKDSAAAKP